MILAYFYDGDTGVFSGNTYSGTRAELLSNTPAGLQVWETIDGAKLDHRCQRVDVRVGKLVDYQPPGPADTSHVQYTWDATSKSWLGAETTVGAASRARAFRHGLLNGCDWTQMADVELSPQSKIAWMKYRKALRDIPKQIDFPL